MEQVVAATCAGRLRGYGQDGDPGGHLNGMCQGDHSA